MMCCMLVLLCGCKKRKKMEIEEVELPPKPVLPKPAGGIVLSIESTAITVDELIEPVRPQLAQLAVEYDYTIFKRKASALMGGVLMQKIADIKLSTMGISIDELTKEQIKYMTDYAAGT